MASIQSSRPLRIASFGFRSFPPREGSAGADKYVLELLPRLAAQGHQVVAYNRAHFDEPRVPTHELLGVQVRTIRTFRRSGLEALWHSFRVTLDIILRNRSDVVHMQNGGNSPFGLLLRVFGKKTFLTEDGMEWDREKWSPAARAYLRATRFLTARVHNQVIFDNVFAKEYFERRYRRTYALIPYGSDVTYDPANTQVLERLGLAPGEYFLFVGRFIPDKGLHYLLPAFESLDTAKKLVMVGGSVPRSEYEDELRSTTDERIIIPGYMYGSDVHALMSNCFAYIQPSDIEGLSPVILESSFLGAPVICSDIVMNRYALQDDGVYFTKGDPESLHAQLARAIEEPQWIRECGRRQRRHVVANYSWDRVVEQHVEIFVSAG